MGASGGVRPPHAVVHLLHRLDALLRQLLHRGSPHSAAALSNTLKNNTDENAIVSAQGYKAWQRI